MYSYNSRIIASLQQWLRTHSSRRTIRFLRGHRSLRSLVAAPTALRMESFNQTSPVVSARAARGLSRHASCPRWEVLALMPHNVHWSSASSSGTCARSQIVRTRAHLGRRQRPAPPRQTPFGGPKVPHAACSPGCRHERRHRRRHRRRH